MYTKDLRTMMAFDPKYFDVKQNCLYYALHDGEFLQAVQSSRCNHLYVLVCPNVLSLFLSQAKITHSQ